MSLVDLNFPDLCTKALCNNFLISLKQHLSQRSPHGGERGLVLLLRRMSWRNHLTPFMMHRHHHHHHHHHLLLIVSCNSHIFVFCNDLYDLLGSSSIMIGRRRLLTPQLLPRALGGCLGCCKIRQQQELETEVLGMMIWDLKKPRGICLWDSKATGTSKPLRYLCGIGG